MTEIPTHEPVKQIPLTQRILESLAQNPTAILVGTIIKDRELKSALKSVEKFDYLSVKNTGIFVAPKEPIFDPDALQSFMLDLTSIPADANKPFALEQESVRTRMIGRSLNLGKLYFKEKLGEANVSLDFTETTNANGHIPTNNWPLVNDITVHVYPNEFCAKRVLDYRADHYDYDDHEGFLAMASYVLPEMILRELREDTDPFVSKWFED